MTFCKYCGDTFTPYEAPIRDFTGVPQRYCSKSCKKTAAKKRAKARYKEWRKTHTKEPRVPLSAVVYRQRYEEGKSRLQAYSSFDELSVEEQQRLIAEKMGVSRSTVWRWKKAAESQNLIAPVVSVV